MTVVAAWIRNRPQIPELVVAAVLTILMFVPASTVVSVMPRSRRRWVPPETAESLRP